MSARASTIFLTGACLLVGAAVVAGVAIVGGPGSARLRKFDDERLQSLRRLAAAIDSHYAARHQLPSDLNALASETGDLTPSALQDPATGAAYGYQRQGPAEYRLCAQFSTASDAQTPIRWRHGRGQTCYSLTAPQAKKPDPR
jgi:hypothetical protein